MTIKDFLYEEWCNTCDSEGKAIDVFYERFIPSCQASDIEFLFIAALTEEGRRAFYAGMEAYRRVALEFGLCGSIDMTNDN